MVIILPLIFFPKASQFDNLDKAAIGAYKGQIFVGGILGMGMPLGTVIDNENSFVKNSTYTFSDTNVTKKVGLTHQSLTFGISGEYMPIDYIGARGKLSYDNIIQRTTFGNDYKNFKKDLLTIYSLEIGPAFHLTNRKPWDVIASPMIGFGYHKFKPAPVATEIVSNVKSSGEKDFFQIDYGMDLYGTMYFKDNLYISLGIQWKMVNIDNAGNVSINNGSKVTSYKKSGYINIFNIFIASGYAFNR